MAAVSYQVTSSNYNANNTITCNVGDTLSITHLKSGIMCYGIYTTNYSTPATIPSLSYARQASDSSYRIYSGSGTLTKAGTYTLTKGAVSSMAHERGGTITIIVNDDSTSMKLNVDGTYKNGNPYVNVDGTWKKGVAYVNVDGTWKKGTK